MTKSEIDRLGERLRVRAAAEDLRQLDAYRISFRPSYEFVVTALEKDLGLEISGRPAKSTTAIREKLHRSSMRLSQMQDLAGCRVIVPEIQAQDEVIDRVSALFAASVLDRRTKPNFGYRAVHLNVSRNGFNIEVQIRTRLQHLWAIYSERLADRFGNELKYGGGPERLRSMLGSASKMVEEFEMFEANFPESHIADPLRDVVRQALEFFLAVAEGRRP